MREVIFRTHLHTPPLLLFLLPNKGFSAYLTRRRNGRACLSRDEQNESLISKVYTHLKSICTYTLTLQHTHSPGSWTTRLHRDTAE